MDTIYAQEQLSFSRAKRFMTQTLLFSFLGIIILLLLFLVIYMGDLLINTMKGDSRRPLFGTYVIMSGSMNPTIQVKDGIVIKRIDHDNYKIGDIITFYSNNPNYVGSTITHRIINKEEIDESHSLYTTKGDHNVSKDSYLVGTDSICGKVLFKIPKFGYVQDFFSNPIHIFSCILGISILYILLQGSRIIYYFNKKRDV